MKRRTIFDDNWYIIQTILGAASFKKVSANFYSFFRSKNYPIPDKGFKNLQEAMGWSLNLSNAKINFNSQFEKIFEFYNIPDTNICVRQALKDVLLYKKLPRTVTSPIEIKKMYFDDAAGVHFDIRVTKSTTKDDFEMLWSKINTLFHRELKLADSRNQPWKEYIADKKLYILGLQAKKKLKAGEKSKVTNNRAVPDMMRSLINDPSNKINFVDDSTIYNALERFEEFLNRTNLKNVT